ncbi:M4 family metallopeptidase [Dyadobacter sp. LHD-138]|uniref:M4 family metallopeptidase n=1 Tax=Dyadobacter sp. LHD-138 TaxID=3071413 RepID=UPI0027E032CD|nr:M4 family metallopeptidase [Dyadobacter sp. LHD-138]MDQ6482446.1 M4 family metallopeptidase [Dyadobacter sp. LHD-138]
MIKKILQAVLGIFLCAEASFAQNAVKSAIDAFAVTTGSTSTIDKATNSISFMRFSTGRAYQINGVDVQQKSSNFMSVNPKIFGLRANEDSFRFRAQRTDKHGLEHVTLQQTYKGVPVFDGMYRFHYNKNRELTALNGNFISEIKVNPVPTLAQHEAEALAIKYVQKGVLEKTEKQLRVHKSTIYIFQKGLAQGYNGSKSLVYEVEVRNDVDIREFLYIDAHSGVLVEQFTGMHSALHRTLYETAISNDNKKWDEGDALPGTLDEWQESEVETSGFIYNLMKNAFGQVSYDGFDAPMITVNNDPNIFCPNASWNGMSANYCTGIATDDVVAHEWGHAYTEYTSNLIYGWQAGALNEAYSDIWGETVDMLDNYMDDGESNALRTACGSSTRWLVGEKAISMGGALRDMWDPTCKGSPGKVSDPQYWCASNDGGGVHTNSGVLNHAYALLVDGGTYNGQVISGLGLVKAAHIFWRAQSEYMTATTDFAAQADYLESALADLIGTDLQGLTTSTNPVGSSGEIITAADALELKKVLLAVELRREVPCTFQVILQPVPTLCEGATANFALFSEDFESGLIERGFNMTAETLSGTWIARNWITSTAPGGRAGKVAFGVDFGGDCVSDQSGILRLESPLIPIPAGTAGNLNMVFDHYINTEEGYDGGNIKYSIDGGDWTLLPATAFTANGYNKLLYSAVAGNSNLLESQPAFTGSDKGGFKGSWGQSQIDLTAIGLTPGSTIQFRWELGTDYCGGLDGWYLDDIRVYSCAVTPAVHFVTDQSAVNEGEATTVSGCMKYIDKTVTVQIDKAPTNPVIVHFNTPTGTAKMGSTGDYTITPSSVTLQAGALTQNVTVRIFNDAYIEGNETINLSYSLDVNGGNGFAGSLFQSHELTIVDDDLATGNYTEVLMNSGFNYGSSGWIVKNGGNSNHTWQDIEYSGVALDTGGRPFFLVDSDATGDPAITMDEIIESPPINTLGKKNLVLTFAQDWFPYDGGFAEQGLVDVWDGNNWYNVLTQTETSGRLGSLLGAANVQTIHIPDAYANVNMKIRFRYKASYDNYWAVDNVKLTSSHSTDILTAINTGNAAQQYLGPNETAAFYDPATGNLMAKIKNLTAHDYGCTSVEIDRAGVDETSWVGTYKITNKTFKVTPTHNNPAGKYEITLYYKAAELPNFNGSDITSMGKSAGSIGVGNVASSSFAEIQASAAFNTDLAYTATFNSGFSGFGLSNAPPVGPLPVTLTTFEGKNTVEGNLLNWATTMEVNNEYFAVERTIDGKNFAEIGKVSGFGNSSVLNRYKFLDSANPKGISYYRLKQVDKGGKYAYSRIIDVNALNTKEIKFFPNPVQSMLTLELPDPEIKSVQVQIINSAGQKVFVKDAVKIVSGNFNLDVSKLPAGVYQVILSGDKKTYNISVLKL